MSHSHVKSVKRTDMGRQLKKMTEQSRLDRAKNAGRCRDPKCPNRGVIHYHVEPIS